MFVQTVNDILCFDRHKNKQQCFDGANILWKVYVHEDLI